MELKTIVFQPEMDTYEDVDSLRYLLLPYFILVYLVFFTSNTPGYSQNYSNVASETASTIHTVTNPLVVV